MNNVFDFKRFGNYLVYDLRRAYNNYGLSLLIMGLIPAIIYFVFQFFSLIGSHSVNELPDEMKFTGVFIVCMIVIFGAGTRIWGSITEKRAGSAYLMLPASTLEKWLSMGLLVCFIVPAALLVLTFASDAIMGWFFPNTYGTRLFDTGFARGLFDGLMDAEEGISFNLPALLLLSWCENILVFTLGAVCFKKAKVAKTLLCIFGAGMVFSFLMVVFFGINGFHPEDLDTFSDPVKAARIFNWVVSLFYIVIIGGLLGGLYYRLRTLKH